MVKSFKQFNEIEELSVSIHNLIELQYFTDMDINLLTEETLTEFKMPDIMGAISKAGLHVKKGRGLIQMIASVGTHFAKILYHAIKASGGDEGSNSILKELLGKKIKKEDFIDFLLKLDQVTLHAITGPIHAIEAITGWHLWAAVGHVRDVAKNLQQKSTDIINKLKDISADLQGSGKKYIQKVAASVEKFFLPTIDTKSIKA